VCGNRRLLSAAVANDGYSVATDNNCHTVPTIVATNSTQELSTNLCNLRTVSTRTRSSCSNWSRAEAARCTACLVAACARSTASQMLFKAPFRISITVSSSSWEVVLCVLSVWGGVCHNPERLINHPKVGIIIRASTNNQHLVITRS
jgi:hypothetical protein